MQKLKILIPTDFSVQAEFAYLLVRNLGKKIDVDIHYIHVLDVPDTVSINAEGKIETCGDIDEGYVKSKKEIADKNLENIRKKYGDTIQTHLVAGKITDNIIFFSETHNIDLIVMGTKGAWGIRDKLSGSETQMVVRNSKIPILSMMCDRSDLNINNILMVHDFNKPVNEDLKLLQTFIKAYDPKIHLLQIVNDDLEKPGLLSQMDSFAKMKGIFKYEKHLLHDKDVENGVIHFNQMHNMDLICLGTHGRKGIQRILHPSATEKLINHLFKPILTFHLTS